jgi:hypothetical protein
MKSISQLLILKRVAQLCTFIDTVNGLRQPLDLEHGKSDAIICLVVM